MATDRSKLLQELRIDREDRDERGNALSRGASGPRKWTIGGVVFVLLAAAVAAIFLSRQSTRTSAEHSAAPVTAAADGPSGSSASASSAAVLQATGYVTARRQATVSAQITGALVEVLIEEGEQVRPGQVLARLDSKAQQASLEQAQAQLRAAEALRRQFQAELAQAQRDLARTVDLVGRKLLSEQALETARTTVETLGAQEQSQQQQVALAQAAVVGAQVQLSYTTVRAPFGGVVVAKAAQPGEIISPISAGGGFTRTGVGTIVDMDSLEIEVDVNERYINRVTPGQRAEAVLDAYPDWTIPVRVIAIVPTADRSKATVKVRVAIDEKDPRILPDMGVRVSFLEGDA